MGEGREWYAEGKMKRVARGDTAVLVAGQPTRRRVSLEQHNTSCGDGGRYNRPNRVLFWVRYANGEELLITAYATVIMHRLAVQLGESVQHRLGFEKGTESCTLEYTI